MKKLSPVFVSANGCIAKPNWSMDKPEALAWLRLKFEEEPWGLGVLCDGDRITAVSKSTIALVFDF